MAQPPYEFRDPIAALRKPLLAMKEDSTSAGATPGSSQPAPKAEEPTQVVLSLQELDQRHSEWGVDYTFPRFKSTVKGGLKMLCIGTFSVSKGKTDLYLWVSEVTQDTKVQFVYFDQGKMVCLDLAVMYPELHPEVASLVWPFQSVLSETTMKLSSNQWKLGFKYFAQCLFLANSLRTSIYMETTEFAKHGKSLLQQLQLQRAPAFHQRPDDEDKDDSRNFNVIRLFNWLNPKYQLTIDRPDIYLSDSDSLIYLELTAEDPVWTLWEFQFAVNTLETLEKTGLEHRRSEYGRLEVLKSLLESKHTSCVIGTAIDPTDFTVRDVSVLTDYSVVI